MAPGQHLRQSSAPQWWSALDPVDQGAAQVGEQGEPLFGPAPGWWWEIRRDGGYAGFPGRRACVGEEQHGEAHGAGRAAVSVQQERVVPQAGERGWHGDRSGKVQVEGDLKTETDSTLFARRRTSGRLCVVFGVACAIVTTGLDPGGQVPELRRLREQSEQGSEVCGEVFVGEGAAALGLGHGAPDPARRDGAEAAGLRVVSALHVPLVPVPHRGEVAEGKQGQVVGEAPETSILTTCLSVGKGYKPSVGF